MSVSRTQANQSSSGDLYGVDLKVETEVQVLGFCSSDMVDNRKVESNLLKPTAMTSTKVILRFVSYFVLPCLSLCSSFLLFPENLFLEGQTLLYFVVIQPPKF